MTHSEELARTALEIGAIKIDPERPFTWASGYKMPVYNDNRLLLGSFAHRMLVADGFRAIITAEKIAVDVVAGTATAGIPHATTLANHLQTPLIYVRSAAKAHGMKNQIEGILKPGQKTVVVEDLISTGESAVKTVRAVREAGGVADHCLCIFNYGFKTSAELFREERCQLHSLLTFPALVDYAEKWGKITPEQARILHAWYPDPFAWQDRQTR